MGTRSKLAYSLLPVLLFLGLWETTARLAILPGQVLVPSFTEVTEEFFLLLQSGRPAEAATWFQRARAFGPDPLRDLCWLGRARRVAGDRVGAIAAAEELLHERPGNPCAEALLDGIREESGNE